MRDAGFIHEIIIMAVESISYTDSPQNTETVMVRVKVRTTEVKCFGYYDLIEMDGGVEALEKFRGGKPDT